MTLRLTTPASDAVDPRLAVALERFRGWVHSVNAPSSYGFWPQEEALRGWLAGALASTEAVDGIDGSDGAYCHPRHAIEEVTFGEEEFEPSVGVEPRTPDARARYASALRRHYVRFDLTISSGTPLGACRSFQTFAPRPRLVLELKAFNCASGLKARSICSDIVKLDGARRWWAEAGFPQPDPLMVVVATSVKDCRDANDASRRIGQLADELRGLATSGEVPSRVPIAMVLPAAMAPTVEWVVTGP